MPINRFMRSKARFLCLVVEDASLKTCIVHNLGRGQIFWC